MGPNGVQLNPQQQVAANHHAGPLVVFAGAGSGKTRVITHRIAHLITRHGIAPHRILAVTFTNRAAAEMRERVSDLLAFDASRLWVGTFHAICARLLRQHADAVGILPRFNIYDDSDQKAVLKRVVKDLGYDEKRFPPKMFAAEINRAKQEMKGPEDLDADHPMAGPTKEVYTQYEQRLLQSGALDFGDLIFQLTRALERDETLRQAVTHQFDHLLVDEFQDTNHAQFRWVDVLAKGHRNLCVVGDDDQSIYAWRGADRRNILDFRQHYPEATVVKLEQNYRSTKRILRIANAVITRSEEREPKSLWTDNPDGECALAVCCGDEREEARLVLQGVQEAIDQGRALTDLAVLYRTHVQSRVLEESLRRANVPYRILGGTRFYDRAEVKDVLGYLRLLTNPSDDVNLVRVINQPPRGIGKTTVDRLLTEATLRGISAWEMLPRLGEQTSIRPAAQKKLTAFWQSMEGLHRHLDSAQSLHEVGRQVVDATGYLEHLKGQDSHEAEARMENVGELMGSLDEYDRDHEAQWAGDPPPGATAMLQNFLEEVSLASTADQELNTESLTLMTVHGAKGLEFPVVFVPGLEENLFPLVRQDSLGDSEEMDEERRLAYVAFTRAREQLILSTARQRRIHGQFRINPPSRFLLELPKEDVEWIGWERPAPSVGYAPSGGRAQGAGATSKKKRWEEDLSEYTQVEGSYVDYGEASEGEEFPFRKGMVVRHPTFGTGTVIKIRGGLPPRVEVNFPESGRRELLASFLEAAHG